MTSAQKAAVVAADELAPGSPVTNEVAGESLGVVVIGGELRELLSLEISSLSTRLSARIAGCNPAHVKLLASVPELPPITVHGPTMSVVDGIHRIAAARANDQDTIRAVLIDGSETDAYVSGVLTNASHGLPLSLSERTAAGRRLVSTIPEWSDRRIADVCGLSPTTIAALRDDAAPSKTVDRRVGRDGKLRPTDPATLRIRVAEKIAQNPTASIRSLALAEGTSQATVRDVKQRLERGASPLPRRFARPEASAVGPSGPPISSPVLAEDHAMRASEQLKEFSQFFDESKVVDSDWASAVAIIPISRAYDIIDEAQRRAASWHRLADELKRRVHNR